MADIDELTRRFRELSESCLPRAPLYSRLAAGVADDSELIALMLAAPPEQHNPTLLLAAIHDLVLRGCAPELAEFFPNVTERPADGDPVPALRATAMARADELRAMLATRRTQTNEIGRCATLLPVLGALAGARGPLAMVDVGTSAGLNLRLDHYHYRYEPGGEVGPSAPVELVCGTRGPVPVPHTMPVITRGVGLDSAPIDVADADAVRWLEACVWPDQADRFARLRAAVAIATADPPQVRRGDAVDDVTATIALAVGADSSTHPVVTTTWMLNYLPVERQRAFVEALDGCGAGQDLSWVVAESPAQTPGLPIPTTAEPEHATVVSLVAWRGGRRTVTRLGEAHPHGYWLHWTAPTDAATPPPW